MSQITQIPIKLLNYFPLFEIVANMKTVLKKLPIVITIGRPSSGKGIIIQRLIGHYFIPTAYRNITIKPLKITIINLPNQQTQPIIFSKESDNIYHQINTFQDLKEIIHKKNVDPKITMIKVKIHTPKCPSMIFIDLPPVQRNYLPSCINIDQEPIKKYAKMENAIILNVLSANVDATVDDAMHLCRTLDPEGIRTIGVLTKIDIMDKGTNAKRTLLNQEVGLPLGYFATINALDIDGETETLQKNEKLFFSTSRPYDSMDEKYFGINNLKHRIYEVFFAYLEYHSNFYFSEIEEWKKFYSRKLPILDTTSKIYRFSVLLESAILGSLKSKSQNKSITIAQNLAMRKISAILYNYYENSDSEVFLREFNSLLIFYLKNYMEALWIKIENAIWRIGKLYTNPNYIEEILKKCLNLWNSILESKISSIPLIHKSWFFQNLFEDYQQYLKSIKSHSMEKVNELIIQILQTSTRNHLLDVISKNLTKWIHCLIISEFGQYFCQYKINQSLNEIPMTEEDILYKNKFDQYENAKKQLTELCQLISSMGINPEISELYHKQKITRVNKLPSENKYVPTKIKMTISHLFGERTSLFGNPSLSDKSCEAPY